MHAAGYRRRHLLRGRGRRALALIVDRGLAPGFFDTRVGLAAASGAEDDPGFGGSDGEGDVFEDGLEIEGDADLRLRQGFFVSP